MRFAVALLVSVSGLAWAHDADVVSVVLSVDAAGAVQESVRLTPATLALLVPLDLDGDGLFTASELSSREHAVQLGVWDEMPLALGGQPCRRELTSATLLDGLVLLSARFQCAGGELRQDFRWLRVLPPNYRVLLGAERAGQFEVRASAQLPQTAVTLPGLDAWNSNRGLGVAVGEGVDLLFSGGRVWAVLALLVAVGRWRRGLLTLAAVSLSTVATAWLEVTPLAWRALLCVAVLAALVQEDPALVLGLILGAGLGGSVAAGVLWTDGAVRLGGLLGGAWLAGVGALAVGVMLRRRPPVRTWVTRLMALAATAVVGISG